MKLTIIYDNEAGQADLQADWGFACLVEAEGRTLLFDTGAKPDVLRHNMARLGLAAAQIPEIFISHGHWDHVGGLKDLLHLNPAATVHVPGSCSGPENARQVIRGEGPYELSRNMFSTGELPGGEQSLVVRTAGGLAVVCGCAHPGVAAILQAASRFGRVAALIGGLHGFQELDLLADMELICPCHCTQQQAAILARFPRTAVRGGAGKILQI